MEEESSEESSEIINIENNEANKEYTILRTIGRGAFGTVYLAVKQGNENERFALKETYQDMRYKNREGEVLKMISHPGIVKVFDIFYSKRRSATYLNIVMEYLPESLHDLIERKDGQYSLLSYSDINWYSFQLFRTCGYLSTLKLCHRDIKPQNILVNHQKKIIKLCDFGSAKILDSVSDNKHYICSRFYRAPELLYKSTQYSCNVDLWSVGCCMAEMYLAQPLFTGSNTKHQILLIKNVLGSTMKNYPDKYLTNWNSTKNKGIASISKWKKVLNIDKNKKKLKYPPDQLKDLNQCHDLKFLQQILQYNPYKRLNLRQTFFHPYFRKYTFPQETSNNNDNNNLSENTIYPIIKWSKHELEILDSIKTERQR